LKISRISCCVLGVCSGRQLPRSQHNSAQLEDGEFQEAPCTAVLRYFYYHLFTDCGAAPTETEEVPKMVR
jgi:hypothetical protein